MERVTFMSCHLLRQEAKRLHRQLHDLQLVRDGNVPATAIMAHKPTFDLMLEKVLDLQGQLQLQVREVGNLSAIPGEGRRFIETARGVLKDTDALVDLLTRLGAE